jgi:hypothetical protein
MTTTLVVHEPEVEQVYNYKSMEEMTAELARIFNQSEHVQSLTVVVCDEGEIDNMTICVNSND